MIKGLFRRDTFFDVCFSSCTMSDRPKYNYTVPQTKKSKRMMVMKMEKILEDTMDVEDSIETEELIVPDEVVVEGCDLFISQRVPFGWDPQNTKMGVNPINSSGSVIWT